MKKLLTLVFLFVILLAGCSTADVTYKLTDKCECGHYHKWHDDGGYGKCLINECDCEFFFYWGEDE